MTAVYRRVSPGGLGQQLKRRYLDITGPTAYSRTTGIALTPAHVGLSRIVNVTPSVDAAAVAMLVFDGVNELHAFSTAASGFTEITANANLSAATWRVVVEGI